MNWPLTVYAEWPVEVAAGGEARASTGAGKLVAESAHDFMDMVEAAADSGKRYRLAVLP